MTFRVRISRIRPTIAGILDDEFMAWLISRLRQTSETSSRYHVSRWETVR